MRKYNRIVRIGKSLIPVMLVPIGIYMGMETSKQHRIETNIKNAVTKNVEIVCTTPDSTRHLSWTSDVEVATTTVDDTYSTTEPNWNNLGNVLPVLDSDCTITLDKDLQNYIYNTSVEFGVPYELTLAVCYMESKFTADVNNAGTNTDGTTDWGIMGLNDMYLQANCDLYNNGIMIDAYNPYQNIYIGVQILASNLNYFNGNILDAANAYNLGPAGWENMKSCGQSWYYGDTVLRYIDVLKTMI